MTASGLDASGNAPVAVPTEGSDGNASYAEHLEQLTQELHQAREKLEDYRRYIADQHELLPLGSLLVTEDGLIRQANSCAVLMLTRNHSIPHDLPLNNYVDSADEITFTDALRRLFALKTPQDLEARLIRGDGSAFQARISMTLEMPADSRSMARVRIVEEFGRDTRGNVMSTYGVDVMAVFDGMPVLLCVLDERRQVIFANKAMRVFLNMSADELSQGRAGDFLGCFNAGQDARGCGFTDACVHCELDSAIQSTLRTGDAYQEIEFKTTLRRNPSSREVVLLVATARLKVEGRNRVLLSCMDITDRHWMEQDLREFRERFQILFQTTPDAIILSRYEDGVVTEVNEAYMALSGFARNEILGKSTLELRIWEKAEDRQKFVDLLSKHGSCVNSQITFRFKGDRLVTTLLSGRIVHLQGVPYILSVLRDITEQKQIELALAKSERQFRLLFDNNKDAILWADVNGFLVRCNQAAEDLFERKRNELLGLHHSELYPMENSDHYDGIFKENIRDRNNHSLEAEIITRSGETKHVQILSTIIEVDGQTIKQGVFVDISERVFAREQIQYQISLQHLLMDLSLIFLNVPTEFLDDALHEALARVGEFTQTDRAYIFSYDFARQMMHNTHEWCASGIEPEIHHLQNVRLNAVRKQIIRHKAGEPFYINSVEDLPVADPLRGYLLDHGILSVLTLPLLTGQECIGFLGFDSVARVREWTTTEIKLFMVLAELLVNVHRRRHREAELHSARGEAERANIAKSRFLATMSHEIRTPMNGVLGMTELLMDTSLDDEQREYAQVIQSSGQALLSLINDILDFSKIEAEKLELEEASFNLWNILEETVRLLSVTARNKHLKLDWKIDPEIPVHLRGDPLRLRQILLNLGGNAVKFTEFGQVEISVRRESDSPIQTGRASVKHPEMEYLRFSIRDTGIGIPEDMVESLFSLFHQVDASTTRRFGGTGLGLAISRRLVEMMGGDIGVKSTVGQGSTFWFRVGFAVVREGGADESAALRVPGPSCRRPRIPLDARVLLVEDNQINQLVAHKMLQKVNISPDMVVNGVEAVAAVRKERYDLVLMDIEMPVMDGLDATAEIRRLEDDNIAGMLESWHYGIEKAERSAKISAPAEQSGGNSAPTAQASQRPSIPAFQHSRIPIIALTAHAVKGDRERFLAAGMDDYLTKPLRFEALVEKLNFWLGDRFGKRDAEAATSSESASQELSRVCDVAELLDRVMGDESMIKVLLNVLIENTFERIKVIKGYLEEGNAGAAGREAHGVKGAALNCSCEDLAAIAATMEAAGKNGELDALRELLPQLERNLEAVRSFADQVAG
ncbi:PAS domain S-box-containing protein [Desulfonatronum thiosulfatophilum]|uniref:Sensory/regulatory protein RpfC n=1 Tax=Desulfonatronum thiosulfatophilum TaxID=617002 RepID=A0A1G6DPN9_9BACT|nr:PAS domain S-box protein [Desulfonatronum thiosulfatophilum]SDB47071.1 PAS domain S-box-containing protein [Desulfonatronum thiosulfatophilum]